MIEGKKNHYTDTEILELKKAFYQMYDFLEKENKLKIFYSKLGLVEPVKKLSTQGELYDRLEGLCGRCIEINKDVISVMEAVVAKEKASILIASIESLGLEYFKKTVKTHYEKLYNRKIIDIEINNTEDLKLASAKIITGEVANSRVYNVKFMDFHQEVFETIYTEFKALNKEIYNSLPPILNKVGDKEDSNSRKINPSRIHNQEIRR